MENEICNNADIITSATTSTRPTFNGKLVKKGAHINGVGSYQPNMQEINERTILNAEKIYVRYYHERDLMKACLHLTRCDTIIIKENKQFCEFN